MAQVLEEVLARVAFVISITDSKYLLKLLD
jgi:hypothetical protein